jgi:hypothetical protein
MARARRGNARLVTGRSMFNIEGLEEVKDLLKALQNEAPEVYSQELKDGVIRMKAIALSHIKDDTGALSESATTKSSNRQNKRMESLIFGGIVAPHAHLVEFGHRQMSKSGEVVGDVPAHPFLRTAFEEYREILLQKLNQAIDRLTSR